MFAIINGHYDVMTALAESGSNVNLADRTGMTPLYAAVDMHTLPSTFGRPDLTPRVSNGSIAAIRVLLDYGADPNARLETKILKRVYNPGDPRLGEGATPLMRAARGGDVGVMRLLRAAGADPALSQTNGNTLLHLAVGANRGGNNPDRGSDASAMAAVAAILEWGRRSQRDQWRRRHAAARQCDGAGDRGASDRPRSPRRHSEQARPDAARRRIAIAGSEPGDRGAPSSSRWGGISVGRGRGLSNDRRVELEVMAPDCWREV
jgi:hypothetical protein